MISIESLYKDLKTGVSGERLKEISAKIIGHYRSKNLSALKMYPPAKENVVAAKNISALFANLIQSYHPDKLALIHKSIDEAFAAKNIDQLILLKEKYIFEESISAIEEVKYPAGYRESYGYDERDFGYHEHTARGAEENDDDDELDDFARDRDGDSAYEESSFVAAVNRAFFGGLDVALTPGDLNNLEGELELGDFDIRDLHGIEHCVNIKLLDLSCNRIERIGRIGGLYALEKLYLSENRIEDISVLKNLDNLVEIDLSFNMIESIESLVVLKKLQYVNIIGNPIQNMRAVSQLVSRGVIVVHDAIFAPQVKRRGGEI